jgi:nucleoid DNA-binding protein
MRKIEIVTRIADETDLTQVRAEKIVNAILQEIKDALQRGEPVIFEAVWLLSGA